MCQIWITWRFYVMEILPHYWPPCVSGIHRQAVDSPHKRPVKRGFVAFFCVSLNKLLKNSWNVGGLRCHVTSLWCKEIIQFNRTSYHSKYRTMMGLIGLPALDIGIPIILHKASKIKLYFYVYNKECPTPAWISSDNSWSFYGIKYCKLDVGIL